MTADASGGPVIDVLVVDDDEDDYLIARDLLRSGRRRYTLCWARSYDEALEQFATGQFDIALVDHRLGSRTGLELIAALRGKSQTPTVLLTGMDDELLDEEAAGLGAADYLPKAGLTSALIERTIRYALARSAAHRQTQLSEHRFRSIIDRANDALVIVDHPTGTRDGVVTIWNPAAANLFGIPPGRAIGQPLSSLLTLPADTGAQGQGSVYETPVTCLDGRTLIVEVSSSQWPADTGHQVCHIVRDITRQVARREQLERRAERDQLTGLANRSTFHDAVRRAVTAHRDDGATPPAVLYVDLDGFKTVNDTQGHAAGDELLREAARRILTELRPGDVAARLGGDEFAVLVTDSRQPEDIHAIADRCLATLNEPYHVGGVLSRTPTSIGVATAALTDSAETLVHKADQAMYAAKRAGKGRIHTWHPSTDSTGASLPAPRDGNAVTEPSGAPPSG
jgi:diguanylate cyclase (GGDEF)-like protein/PAS domain S-box-containing protein